MRVIPSSYEIVTKLDSREVNREIERVARTCYKSEPNHENEELTSKFVRGLIKSGHEAMIEFFDVTVKFIVDRGILGELTRHRLANFACESSRYCNYSKEKFGSELTFIEPDFPPLSEEPERRNYARITWRTAMKRAEESYKEMIRYGTKPEIARSVLPLSLATELNMKMNLRQWRHFFKLRALGTTGKPHPQMLEVTVPLLKEMKEKLPDIFFDLEELKNE